MDGNEPEQQESIRNPDGTFKQGFSGNPGGRPKGIVSPITRVKQIFNDNPETFESFVLDYMKDPANRKHLVEMIDGKPKQDVNLDATTKNYVITRGEDLQPAQEPATDNTGQG